MYITWSFAAFRHFLFAVFSHTEQSVSLQVRRGWKHKFSSVWSNSCLNGLSIFLLMCFPLVEIHVHWRNEGVETKNMKSWWQGKMWDLQLFYTNNEEWPRAPFVPAGRRGNELLLYIGGWFLRDTWIKESSEDLGTEWQLFVSFLQQVYCSAYVLLKGVLGLPTGIHSNLLVCCFSSTFVTHL